MDLSQPAPPSSISISKSLFLLDAFEVASSQPPGFCDHIVTEPDQMNESDIQRFISFFPLAFRALPETGFFCFWFPIETITRMKTALRASGFLFQPWPLIAYQLDYPRKGGDNCANWYAPSYQSCMIAYKPGTILAKRQGQAVFSYTCKLTRERYCTDFPKSIAIWRWIYSGIAKQGQSIWDPFAGAGTSVIAALVHRLSPIATEIDPITFSLLQSNVKTFFQSKFAQVLNFT